MQSRINILGAVRSAVTSTLLAVIVCAGTLAAQDQACVSRTVPVEVIASAPRAVLPVNTGFRAELDGKPLQIESIVPRSGARRVVIALDTSGSMGQGSAVWSFALSAVKDLVVSLPPGAAVAFVAQSSEMQQTVNFGNDSRRAILATVEKFAADPKLPMGQTPLMNEIDRAFRLFTLPQAGDEIFVVSDAGDNASKESWQHLSKRISAAGVRVSAILVFPVQYPSTDEEMKGPGVFNEFAAATGGHCISVTADLIRKDARLKSSYISAVIDLAQDHGWLITVKTATPPDKTKSWKLQALDEEGKPVKHVDVVYTRWWPSCTDAQ